MFLIFWTHQWTMLCMRIIYKSICVLIMYWFPWIWAGHMHYVHVFAVHELILDIKVSNHLINIYILFRPRRDQLLLSSNSEQNYSLQFAESDLEWYWNDNVCIYRGLKTSQWCQSFQMCRTNDRSFHPRDSSSNRRDIYGNTACNTFSTLDHSTSQAS